VEYVRKWFSRVVLMGVGLFAGLFVVEISLRLYGFSYVNFWRKDPIYGARLKPDTEGWYRKENSVYIRTNRLGFRDRNHSLDKPDNTYRIALLGDSFGAAMQVPLKQTFWRMARKKLDHCSVFDDRTLEVLNFSVPGFGTGQEWLMYRNIARKFSPDLVILAFFPGNDVRNNHRELERAVNPSLVPFFQLKDGRIKIDTGFRTHPEFRSKRSGLRKGYYTLREYLRTLQLISYMKRRINFRRENNDNGQRWLDAGLREDVYRVPEDGSELSEAWAITERLILNLKEDVREDGAKLVISILTSSIQVHPDERLRETVKRKRGVDTLLYPNQRMKRSGENHGIQVIDFGPTFRRIADRTGVFFHGFEYSDSLGNGHWNERAHRRAGNILSNRLCKVLKRTGD